MIVAASAFRGWFRAYTVGTLVVLLVLAVLWRDRATCAPYPKFI
jgi:hypothetical protein